MSIIGADVARNRCDSSVQLKSCDSDTGRVGLQGSELTVMWRDAGNLALRVKAVHVQRQGSEK